MENECIAMENTYNHIDCEHKTVARSIDLIGIFKIIYSHQKDNFLEVMRKCKLYNIHNRETPYLARTKRARIYWG